MQKLLTRMPKVSVNIITFNRKDLLEKALRSVNAQEYKDLEIILVDDCSSESMEEVAGKFANVRYFRNQKNLGVTESRKIALQNSNGEYICVLDDDDYFIDSQKITKQVEFLDANKDYVLVGTRGLFVNKDGKKLSEINPPLEDAQIRRQILYRASFIHSSVMFRRSAALNVGSYRVRSGNAEDYDLWLRLGKMGKLANLDSIMVAYLKNMDGVTGKREMEQLRNSILLTKGFLKEYPNAFLSRIIWYLRLVRALVK